VDSVPATELRAAGPSSQSGTRTGRSRRGRRDDVRNAALVRRGVPRHVRRDRTRPIAGRRRRRRTPTPVAESRCRPAVARPRGRRDGPAAPGRRRQCGSSRSRLTLGGGPRPAGPARRRGRPLRASPPARANGRGTSHRAVLQDHGQPGGPACGRAPQRRCACAAQGPRLLLERRSRRGPVERAARVPRPVTVGRPRRHLDRQGKRHEGAAQGRPPD
jgi:hypothetical protein